MTTPTKIRAPKRVRRRLKVWAAARDMTQGEAIDELLDRAGANEVPDPADADEATGVEETYECDECGEVFTSVQGLGGHRQGGGCPEASADG